MRKAIEDCLRVAPADSGYILASGCEVPGVAPPENVEQFMQIADELTRNRSES